MKKIFTLLTAALVTFTSFADHRDGMLTITQLGKNDICVEIDGRRYNDRDILIRDLEPGRHTVAIYTNERRSEWKNIFDRNGRREYLYNSVIMVRPRQHIDIVINRFGKVWIDDNNDRDDRYGDREDDRGRGRDKDYKYDRPRDNRYDDNRSAMDVRSFEMLKDALRRENFENSRLAIAKQSVERNAFSSLQVKELARLFAFENNKLELAKFAYANTIDKKNYFVVYEVFSFNSSKEELAEYVRRY